MTGVIPLDLDKPIPPIPAFAHLDVEHDSRANVARAIAQAKRIVVVCGELSSMSGLLGG